jgi:hypothetical protein
MASGAKEIISSVSEVIDAGGTGGKRATLFLHNSFRSGQTFTSSSVKASSTL